MHFQALTLKLPPTDAASDPHAYHPSWLRLLPRACLSAVQSPVPAFLHGSPPDDRDMLHSVPPGSRFFPPAAHSSACRSIAQSVHTLRPSLSGCLRRRTSQLLQGCPASLCRLFAHASFRSLQRMHGFPGACPRSPHPSSSHPAKSTPNISCSYDRQDSSLHAPGLWPLHP